MLMKSLVAMFILDMVSTGVLLRGGVAVIDMGIDEGRELQWDAPG